MITIAVCGVAEVPRFAGADLTDIVSIGDFGSFRPDISGYATPPKVHRFEFIDVSHAWEFGPQRDHVQRLLNLFGNMTARKEDTRVLFHCAAGVSRSTASAFILCVYAGMTYQEAYDHILRVRGFLNPNLLMIKIADDLMSKKGEMLDFIINHRWDGAPGNQAAQEWVRNRGWEVTT